jgi:hypothetical protein
MWMFTDIRTLRARRLPLFWEWPRNSLRIVSFEFIRCFTLFCSCPSCPRWKRRWAPWACMITPLSNRIIFRCKRFWFCSALQILGAVTFKHVDWNLLQPLDYYYPSGTPGLGVITGQSSGNSLQSASDSAAAAFAPLSPLDRPPSLAAGSASRVKAWWRCQRELQYI